MVLYSSLLNTQQYKVRIKGKVEQSRERSSVYLGVVAIEKGAFWLLSTKVANFTYFLLVMKNIFMTRIQNEENSSQTLDSLQHFNVNEVYREESFFSVMSIKGHS